MPPSVYSLSEDIRATFVRVLAYMGGLGLVAIAAASIFNVSAVVGAGSGPHSQWSEVERPSPAYELAMPELAAIPANYAISRRAADGARKDVLTWGTAAEPGPFVRVEIYRSGDRTEPFIDPDSEIAARIVGYTITDDVKPAGRIASKFGEVPLVISPSRPMAMNTAASALPAHSRNRRCRSPAGIAVRATRSSIGPRWRVCLTGSPCFRRAVTSASMQCSPAPRSSERSAAAAIRSWRRRPGTPDRLRAGMAETSAISGCAKRIGRADRRRIGDFQRTSFQAQ